jgi:hypothetical protein
MVLVVSTGSPALATGSFSDDDGSVHEANIELIAAAEITVGCGADVYCPDSPVTRAQMASFLVRALGYVDDGGGDRFSDDDNSVHETDIDRLAAAGVTVGCEPDAFCPEAPVTRAQMASFLSRAFHYDQAAPTADHFSDDDGSTHEGNINRLFEAGVTVGCGVDAFCPEAPVTRAQMASFLARALRLPWPPDESGHIDITPELRDAFGSPLAVGDFNADGWDDIAAAAIGENEYEGAVRVIFGTAGGPTGSTQYLSDADFGLTPQPSAYFGRGLAVGDFDGDGFDDLAIGANDANAGGVGRVMLANGSATGITAVGEIMRGFPGELWIEDLAAGEFGAGPEDDLAIGIPRRDVGMNSAAGAVEVQYGSPTGLTQPTVFHQDSDGVAGVAEQDDFFGGALATGDLNGDGIDELVIGVPFEDLSIIDDETNVGAVHVFAGTPDGLDIEGFGPNQLIHQADIGQSNDMDDSFGAAITVGDLTGDGLGDLVVGTPGEDVDSVADRGDVYVIAGSDVGPDTGSVTDLTTIAGTSQPLDAQAGLGHHLGFVAGPDPLVVVPRQVSAASCPAPAGSDDKVYLLAPGGLVSLPIAPLEQHIAQLATATGDIDGDGTVDLIIGARKHPLAADDCTEVGAIAMWNGQHDGSFVVWPGGLIR